MKAVAVFLQSRDLRLVEIDETKLESPTQARLCILDFGVCGTDREICLFQYGTPPHGPVYLVIGHESLGQVVEVGPAVTRLKRVGCHNRPKAVPT